jgi:NADH:ubiquinone oxidoreductase subunit 6 (subunit J)
LSDTAEVGGTFGSPAEIGNLFLSDHLLAFEVTSIVLLVAAIGGVILGSALPREQRAEGGPE